MRSLPVGEPEGLLRVMERIAEIKARFGQTGCGAAFDRLVSLPVESQAMASSADVQQAISSAAARHGIEPAVLSALAYVESGLRPEAVSPDGALGITQLMPATAQALGVANPFDLWANLDGGARYLRQQLDRFGGDLSLALAAYNAGPGAVVQHGGIPPYGETQRFVRRVLDLIPRFRFAR